MRHAALSAEQCHKALQPRAVEGNDSLEMSQDVLRLKYSIELSAWRQDGSHSQRRKLLMAKIKNEGPLPLRQMPQMPLIADEEMGSSAPAVLCPQL